MSKNKWIEVLHPRYDTYKWFNRGAPGHAYVNRNKVVKIMESNEYHDKTDFLKNCEKEIKAEVLVHANYQLSNKC